MTFVTSASRKSVLAYALGILQVVKADVIVSLIKIDNSISLSISEEIMKVEDGKQITLEYTITTQQGELIESSVGRDKPLVFTFGQVSGLPVGITEGLLGMNENEEKEFDIPPEKAFGTVESGPTKMMLKSEFPADADIKVGASFEAYVPQNDETVKFIVTENLGDKVVVRLIHPLAGKTLRILAKVLRVENR
jgi:FKBP-type peptidyl-prolyl cis-trans isomerase 2